MAKAASQTCSMAASIVFIINILTATLSMAVFSFSLWAIASPGSLVYFIQVFGTPALKALVTEDTLNVQLGVGTAVLAVFFFCISLMGCYGAVSGSQFLLFMYATLVILLLLLECSLLFYFSSNIVEKGIQTEGPFTDALRLSLRCCDRNYTSLSESVRPPWSCCGADAYPKNCTAETLFSQDCQRAVKAWLQKYQVSVYVSLAVGHVLVSLCALVRRAGCAHGDHS